MKLSIASLVRGLGFAAVLAIAGHADAANDDTTSSFTIQSLKGTVRGLRVYPMGGVTINPGSCANTSYYEPLPLCVDANQTSKCLMKETRDLYERLLTAAFLAGRPISLKINGTNADPPAPAVPVCGFFGNPAYEEVTLN